MMKKGTALRRIRWAAALCCLLVTVLLCGCEWGTISGRTMENPKQAIAGFMEAMQSERFDHIAAENAMGYVGNYSTMGFEKHTMIEDDSLEKALFDLLRSSYSVEFADSDLSDIATPYRSDDMRVSGKKAYVTVTFTSLDLESMSVPLSEAVSRIGEERVFDGEVFETEESALALIEEVFHTVFDVSDMSEYCVTRQLTVELEYHEDGWKINISDELYDALLGQ